MKINFITNTPSYINLNSLKGKAISKNINFGSQNKDSFQRKEESADSFLSKEQLEKLERDLKETGEKRERAKDRLIMAFSALVYRIAQSYNKGMSESSFGMDDLIQEGFLGLAKAVDKFDIDKGTNFSEFVSVGINRQILKNLKYKNLVSLPRNKRKLFIDATKAYYEIYEKTFKKPTPEQIAEALGVSTQEIEDLIKYNPKIISINLAVSEDLELGDLIKDDSDNARDIVHDKLSKKDLKTDFNKELQRILSPKQYAVLASLYGLGGAKVLNSAQLAELFGVSHTAIYLIENKALKKLAKSGKIKNLFRAYIKNEE